MGPEDVEWIRVALAGTRCANSCAKNNGPSESIKDGEFLVELRDP
jgi:hypothetical protein